MSIGVLLMDLHVAVADCTYRFNDKKVFYEHGSVLEGMKNVKTVLDWSWAERIPIYATKFQKNPLCEMVTNYSHHIIQHNYPNAFIDTTLDGVLKKDQIDTLLVMGFNRDDSVKQTMGDALRLGYNLATSEYILFAIKGDPERRQTLKFFRLAEKIIYLKNTDNVIKYLNDTLPK
jgi:hypothetical protein